ncbi:MAG: YlzJ-like family protein [bacterium]
MINYSIIPNELLFSDYDDFDVNYEEIELDDGLTLMVERIDESSVKVVKIISSNHQDFLRSNIQPGMEIKSSLQL